MQRWTEEEMEDMTLDPEDEAFLKSCSRRTMWYSGISALTFHAAWMYFGLTIKKWAFSKTGLTSIPVAFLGALPGGMFATSECMRQLSTRETRLGEAFRSQIRDRNYRLAIMRGENPHVVQDPNAVPQRKPPRKEEPEEEVQEGVIRLEPPRMTRRDRLSEQRKPPWASQT